MVVLNEFPVNRYLPFSDGSICPYMLFTRDSFCYPSRDESLLSSLVNPKIIQRIWLYHLFLTI